MKNKILFIFFLFLYNSNVFAESIFIESKNISIDKNKETSIFENEVNVKTKDGYIITSDFAEYNKATGILILKRKITGTDKENNIINAEFAKYNENTKILITTGPTKITTSENYIIEGSDITLNNTRKQIFSDRKTVIIDQDKNKIFLDNFDYQIGINIFKSIGNIEVIDDKKNKYEFSQVYIDTKKKKKIRNKKKIFLK